MRTDRGSAEYWVAMILTGIVGVAVTELLQGRYVRSGVGRVTGEMVAMLLVKRFTRRHSGFVERARQENCTKAKATTTSLEKG